MRNVNVGVLLFVAIFVVALAPLLAALQLLERSLQTSLNLGFNRDVAAVLEASSHNLRTLRRLDPENSDRYRAQFERVENLQQVYADPELIKRSIKDSLRIYFGLGLLATVLASVLLAFLLSRRIARTYRLTFAELTSQREKVRYLEEISSWQELAKMLAHEIKNPLTPIEVLVTSLSKSYLSSSSEEFRARLAQTQTMINEELSHLKAIVTRFSEFARLPQVELHEQDLVAVVRQQLGALAGAFEQAQINFSAAPAVSELRARVDATLFRQVLANIIRNGVEANPGRRVTFDVGLHADEQRISLLIGNDGVPVPADIAPRIFDPYISTRQGGDNMGLGLAIVKKIVIEHGGEVAYVHREGRPCFEILLPRST